MEEDGRHIVGGNGKEMGRRDFETAVERQEQ